MGGAEVLLRKMVNKKSTSIRALFINPPTAGIAWQPLLNLGYLAAVLREAGHEVKIIDATAPHRPYTSEEIKKVIAEFRPSFIGVTLTVTNILRTYDFLRDIRKMKIPIIAGGPHANALPEEVVRNAADIVAIGEGEGTILELAEYFSENKKLKEIDGICFKDEADNLLHTSPRRLIEDLDVIPAPDLTDFPIRNYTGSDDANSNPLFWSLFTSRGCPFDCTFCSSHNVFGRTIRMRSAQNIFNEIKQMVDKYGARTITYQDDEILCSKKRFLEFCDIIEKDGLKINMSIRTRIDSIDKELLLRAKGIGLTRMTFGIESFDDETLKNINKKYTARIIREKFEVIKETKFPYISFSIICGWPWETKKHFENNLREIKKIPKSLSFYCTIVTPVPYPKTKFYETYHKKFGLTNWWLNPNLRLIPGRDTENPFFMLFAFRFKPLFETEVFWNYSRDMRNTMETFCWKVFKIFIKRHYRHRLCALIYIFSRISHMLWRLSPKLEHIIFGPLKNKRMMCFRERVVFTTKY